LSDSWHGGDGGKPNRRNFRGGGRPCPHFSSYGRSATSVHVHAALGGDWPRRQPLNVAVLLRPSGEMPVGECPGRRQRRRRQTVANGTTAALVLLLGVCLLAAAAAVADGGLCMALDFKFCDLYFILFGLFSIGHLLFGHIINSASLKNLNCVVFLYTADLAFSKVSL